MKKNWIIFSLICAAAWLWMLNRQIQDAKRFEQEKIEYEERQALYQEQQAERERLEQERLRERQAELARLRQEAEGATVTIPDDPQATPVAPEQTLTAVRELESELFNAYTARRHIVETPLYRVELSELGGRPVSWEIKTSEYVKNLEAQAGDQLSTGSINLIPAVGNLNARDVPLSLVGQLARDYNNDIFNVEREDLPDSTRISFESIPTADNDMVLRREYLFRHDGYVVDLTLTFKNGPSTRKLIGGSQGFGIGWQGGFGGPEVPDRYGVSLVYALADKIRNRTVTGAEVFELPNSVDWAGQESKYFVSLLLPQRTNPPQSLRAFVDRRNEAEEYRLLGASSPMNIDLLHPAKEVAEGETAELLYQVYVGPKNRESLSDGSFVLAPDVKNPNALVFHTVPLGMQFLRPLALMLLDLMRWLYSFLGAWGLAIIGTTLVVRVVIYPLTHWAIKNQARTMIEQQKIRPELEVINKKFKGDPMKRNQAMMQLYRDHGISMLGPLRGCLPILLQMPIFLALYVVFEQSVELRGQPFLWINDLSAPDHLFSWGISLPLLGAYFNLLPVLMAITNYIQMRIMQMPSADETQARIQKQMMTMMPIMFIFFLYHLPSGLILYWTVSNVVSIGQSYMTKRIIASHMAAHETKQAPLAAT